MSKKQIKYYVVASSEKEIKGGELYPFTEKELNDCVKENELTNGDIIYELVPVGKIVGGEQRVEKIK